MQNKKQVITKWTQQICVLWLNFIFTKKSQPLFCGHQRLLSILILFHRLTGRVVDAYLLKYWALSTFSILSQWELALNICFQYCFSFNKLPGPLYLPCRQPPWKNNTQSCTLMDTNFFKPILRYLTIIQTQYKQLILKLKLQQFWTKFQCQSHSHTSFLSNPGQNLVLKSCPSFKFSKTASTSLPNFSFNDSIECQFYLTLL